MLEMMVGAAGGKTVTATFKITPSGYSYSEGSELTFTVEPVNHIKNHAYHWSLGGSVDSTMIDGVASGMLVFRDDGPQTVRIKTHADEFKEDDETMTFQVRHSENGVVLGESPIVNIIYSSLPTGQHTQVATGQRSWVVPEGVTELSAVTVGAGQGADGVPRGRAGDGGALRWRNRIPVTPGETLTLEVGTGGRNSTDPQTRQGGNTTIYRGDTVILRAAGGGNVGSTNINGTTVGGGDGGRGALGGEHGPGGGGGAGGYTGHGGVGGNALVEARDGDGGGAGGGNYYATPANDSHHATAGGGVGLEGQGEDGKAAVRGEAMTGGGGGSKGANGDWITAGAYGGGGRGQSSNVTFGSVNGANGAIRLIWGPSRTYPSTRTQNL